MTIYLYVKTHNITGLKYLGKTSTDPYSYFGSGKYWKEHLKLYGNQVSTEILKECKTKEELSYWGRYYSKLFDIVKSDAWANKIPETGGGPGRSGHHKGKNNPMYGKIRNDLKSPDSPNKKEYRREQSKKLMEDRWQQPNFKERKREQYRKQWSDPIYQEKMKSRLKFTKKVCINNIEYNSLKEAAVILSLDPSTVSKRCSSQHEKFANWNYI